MRTRTPFHILFFFHCNCVDEVIVSTKSFFWHLNSNKSITSQFTHGMAAQLCCCDMHKIGSNLAIRNWIKTESYFIQFQYAGKIFSQIGSNRIKGMLNKSIYRPNTSLLHNNFHWWWFVAYLTPGPSFKLKIIFSRYWDSHYENKAAEDHLYNGNSFIGSKHLYIWSRTLP